MKVEVLVAAMNQDAYRLFEEMNLDSNVIIANQCKFNEVSELKIGKNEIKCLSFNERGVGLNRNNALSRSEADICILADDDMFFYDGYEEKILTLFEENPKAEVIILNIDENDNLRYKINKKHRVGYFNFMKYGATRIAFRRKSVTKKGIFFNLHFGGGTDFSAGEDVLFLYSCIKNNLQVIAVPDTIARLTDERESTWFEGYTDKFFVDKGVLYAAISERWAWLISIQFSLRRYSMFKSEKKWYEACMLMFQGINLYKKLK